MSELFSLPVTYNGKDLEFPFRIVSQGYTHRYVILVDEVEVVYEQDDQGELRAIIYNPELITARLPEQALLEAITSVVRQLVE